MSVATVLSAHPGNTVVVYLAAAAPPEYLVTGEETSKARREKLRRQDELYSCWLESAQDPTKSPSFPNGQLSGYRSGYGGSLFFIQEDSEYRQLVFAHVFEDFSEEEIDPADGTAFRKAKQSGLELARAFQVGQGLKAFRCHLRKLGFSDLTVRHLRYRQGGGV